MLRPAYRQIRHLDEGDETCRCKDATDAAPTGKISCRILVVDDDPDILELLSPVLSDEGFTVKTAQSPWEAIQILDQEQFDLMVTDVSLRELSGPELVHYARSRWPRIKSLFMSGCSDPVTVDPDQDDFVGKPFVLDQLRGCVLELFFRDALPHHVSARQAAKQAEIAAKVANCKRRWQAAG